jgi:hypothetical protein
MFAIGEVVMSCRPSSESPHGHRDPHGALVFPGTSLAVSRSKAPSGQLDHD